MSELSFKELSEANKVRCGVFGHEIRDWSKSEWALAVCGEAGEMANLTKKDKRGDTTYYEKGVLKPLTNEAIAAELADVVIYADLMAQRMGLDLGECVRSKFNEVSVINNSLIRI